MHLASLGCIFKFNVAMNVHIPATRRFLGLFNTISLQPTLLPSVQGKDMEEESDPGMSQ